MYALNNIYNYFVIINLPGAESIPNAADIENHLELGRQFLAHNQLSDALTHYHAAVGKFITIKVLWHSLYISFLSYVFLEGDPSNYLTLFKRGTVYMALGKTRFAIQDFSRVLELKPDFTAARFQRGTVYMKTGEYREAGKDFATVVREVNKIYPSHKLFISDQYVGLQDVRPEFNLQVNYFEEINKKTFFVSFPLAAFCKNFNGK